MNFKKIIIAIIFILIAIIVTALFWKNVWLLSVFLVILAIIKHFLVPIKKEYFWFLLIGSLGATTESLIMYLGNNPWSYETVSFFNFPVWLVFLWGLAGTTFLTLYEGVMKVK